MTPAQPVQPAEPAQPARRRTRRGALARGVREFIFGPPPKRPPPPPLPAAPRPPSRAPGIPELVRAVPRQSADESFRLNLIDSRLGVILIMSGGLLPAAIFILKDFMDSTPTSYEESARANGHAPGRSEWRICSDVYVADTDEQARREALEGSMASAYQQYFFPLVTSFGMAGLWKDREDMAHPAAYVRHLRKSRVAK